MLRHQPRQDLTRLIPNLFCCLIFAAALAGCANTPKRNGIPWWPQGPGNVSEDVLPTTNVEAATHADTPQSPSTQPVSRNPEAVRYGDLFFVSGQIAENPSSLAIVGRDIQTQIRTAMDSLKRILEDHGLTMSNVLSVNLYLQDIDELPQADQVYASYFQRSLPARSVMRVSGLPKGSLVEISAIAGK